MLLAGAIISGWVGLFFATAQRRRDRIADFRSDLSEISDFTKGRDFHASSSEAITRALSRLRPFISAKKFSACKRALAEYKNIPEEQMNRHSQESVAFEFEHHKTPDQRFEEFVEKMEKELA